MARKLRHNWIVSFSSVIDKVSEAPRQFNIWAAISAVGAVLKNHVYIKYGTFTIYPNQYIVMAGTPGVGKGTSIHSAWDIVKSVKPELVNIISDRITAPKIIEKLAAGFTGNVQAASNGTITLTKDSTATLFSTELSTLLSGSDWMLSFLCDAWDKGEFQYDTKNSGSAFVKGMCTSLIGNCVPQYIRNLNKDATAAINSGFTARTIFVYAEKKSKVLDWPVSLESSPQGRKTLQELTDDLIEISKLYGEMSVSPSAMLMYKQYYRSIQIEDEDSDVVMHFKSRLGVHILKLAMIFSCATRDTREILMEDMTNAIQCLNDVLHNLDKAFRGVGESDLTEATARVQSFIEKKGITTRGEILAALHRHVSPENLDRIMALLVSIEFVEGRQVGKRYQYYHKGKKQQVVGTNITQLV